MRRVHDARHAAAAICAGIKEVYSYDLYDWNCFKPDGLHVARPHGVGGKATDE